MRVGDDPGTRKRDSERPVAVGYRGVRLEYILACHRSCRWVRIYARMYVCMHVGIAWRIVLL